MYAIVETGGKQYKLAKGGIVDLEKIKPSRKGELKLDKVLMITDAKKTEIGTPYVKGAKVVCEVISEEVKSRKVRGVKYHRRKDYKVTMGHRQKMVRVKVREIER